MVRAERVLLFGALGMLLVSAVLGGSSGAGATGGREVLLAHVHAGSLGWMTLAVLAVALAMAADADGQPLGSRRWARSLSWLTVGAIAAFVVADAAGSATAKAWAGPAALAAILAFLTWLAVSGTRAGAPWTVARLAMAAALVVLVAGSIIGGILAGAQAGGNVTAAASLASSHSAALTVPFVVLAATSAVEWSAGAPAGQAPPSTAGLVQVGALTLAAVALIAGVLAGDLALVEANVPLEFGGIAIFLVRVGPALLTGGWATGGWARSSRIWLVTGTVALAVDVGLFAHVVVEVGARRYVTIDMIPRWLPFAVDHVTFVAVGTAALFGAIAAMAGQEDRWPMIDVLAATGLAAGLVATVVGIGVGSAVLEGASAAVLGMSVLAAAAMAGIRVRAITCPRQAGPAAGRGRLRQEPEPRR